jgi:hypothetical protein
VCVDNNWSSIDGDTDECGVGLFVSVVVDDVGVIVEGDRDGKREIIV